MEESQAGSADLFLNQTFKFYKSNQALSTLSENQVDYIKRNLSRYLYSKYLQSSRQEELIPRFKSASDVYGKLKITHGSHNSKYQIQYLVIRCNTLLSRQTFIFVTKDSHDKNTFNTVILKRDTTSEANGSAGTKRATDAFILSLLENLVELRVPMVVRELRLQHKHILAITNRVFSSLARSEHGEATDFGDLEITYGAGNNKVINNHLRNITINVPKSDIGKFAATAPESPMVTKIHDFIHANTQIKLHNLYIVRFASSLLTLSVDGRVRISGERLQAQLREEVVWCVLESVYS